MKTMGAFDAKTHFSSLLEQVEQGEEFTITKHGHPIAKLVSIKSHGRQHISNAIQRLKTLGKTHSLGDLNWKALRDEGRR